MILFAYISFLVAEIATLSGVMSLFLCGIVMKHYNWYSLSSDAQISTNHVFKTAAFVAETSVFIYLGINLFNTTQLHWDPVLIACSMGLLFLSRALNIFPLSALANLRRKVKVNFKMQIMLWFAGLRGAVAFALALNVTTAGSSVIVTTTLFIVLFTTLILGLLTSPVIKKLGLIKRTGNRDEEGESLLLTSIDDDDGSQDHLNLATPREEEAFEETEQLRFRKQKITFLHKYWKIADEKFMKPWFGGKPRAGYSIE